MGKQNQMHTPLHEQPCGCDQCIVHIDTTQMPALPLCQPHYQPQPHFDYQTYPRLQPYGRAQLGSQIQPQSQFASESQVNIQPQLQTQYPPRSSFQLQPQFPFQPQIQPEPQYQPFPPPPHGQPQPHPLFQAQLQVPFQPPPRPQLPNQPQIPSHNLTRNLSNPAPTAPSQGTNYTPLDQAQDIYSLVRKAYPISSESVQLSKASSNPLDGMKWTLGNAARPAVQEIMTSATNTAGKETGGQLPTTNNAAIEADLPTAMMQLPDLDFFFPSISRTDTQDTFSEFAQGQGPLNGFCDGGNMARGDYFGEIGEGRDMKKGAEADEDLGWQSK